VVRQRVEDSHEQVRLGGIGTWLSREIQDATGRESRAVVLGHIQRGGTPTARDRVLGTRFGREAMVQAARGNFDLMVGLSGTEIVPASLEGIADRQRLVDPDGQLVAAARSVGTCLGDR
jgi:6-phosphofructokinase 1